MTKSFELVDNGTINYYTTQEVAIKTKAPITSKIKGVYEIFANSLK